MDRKTAGMARTVRIWHMGKWRFVLLIGALMWGVGFLVVFETVMWFIAGRYSDDFWKQIPLAIVICPLVGVKFGLRMWTMADFQCRQRLSQGLCLVCGQRLAVAGAPCPNCGNAN